MPSRRATARASATVSGEQQLPNFRVGSSGSRHGHTRSVIPMTSTPCSTRRAAATDESTPPLRPTTMRSCMPSILARGRRDQLGQAIELLAGGVGDLDAARALAADEAHAGGQRHAKRVLDRGELRRPPEMPAHRARALGLYALLGRAHGPRVRQDLLAKTELLGR